MDENRPECGRVKPPAKNPAARHSRAAVRGVVNAIPVAGGVVAELADAILPDPEGKEHDRWVGDVTNTVNDIEDRVGNLESDTGSSTTNVTLTGATAAIAKHMIETCPNGLAPNRVSLDDVLAAYPDFTRRELLDGFGDLERYGLIRTSSAVNRADLYRLTEDAYETLDPPIMGWNTIDDARELARLALEFSGNVATDQLEAQSGWSRRRFNPAHRIIVGMIAPGRVGQSIQPDFVTRFFIPNNAERAALRHFAAGN